MKKLMICVLSIFMLAGCGKKQKTDPDVTPDTRESVSIGEIDFTQADAEKVFAKALSEYCGSSACEVVSVRISGNDITGVYSYLENGFSRQADAVLHDVSVSPADKTKYTAASSEFKGNTPDTPEPEVTPETAEDPEETADPEKKEDPEKTAEPDKKDDKSKKYDIPDKVDEDEEDAKNDKKVYDENGIQIWRVYSYKGKIEFTGTYEGNTKFLIQVMDLKQNVKGEPVNMKKAGDIEGSMKLDEEGYYYIKIEAQGGWSLYWNRTYE